MVDQVHPHTAQANKDVGYDQISTIKVDCASEIAKLKHRQQNGTVAHQCQHQGHQVEQNFAVVHKVQ